MKTCKRERLVAGCTDTVLSLPYPPPSNAGVGVKQIDHRKSEGLFSRGWLGRVPFESLPEQQVVLETLTEKLVSGGERQVHLKIVGQEEYSVDRRQMRKVKYADGVELVHKTSCPISKYIFYYRVVSQPKG